MHRGWGDARQHCEHSIDVMINFLRRGRPDLKNRVVNALVVSIHLAILPTFPPPPQHGWQLFISGLARSAAPSSRWHRGYSSKKSNINSQQQEGDGNDHPTFPSFVMRTSVRRTSRHHH
jgi:hypothetical protein